MYSNQNYLAELLVEAGVVDSGQVTAIRQSSPGLKNEVERLQELHLIDQVAVAQVIANNSGSQYVDLNQYVFPEGTQDLIPKETAERYFVVPLLDDGVTVSVAVADALDFSVQDTISTMIGREVTLYVATPSSIKDCLSNLYNSSLDGSLDGPVTVVGAEGAETAAEGDAPIIKLVNQMLTDAIKMGTSDIHIEPLETSIRIRFRVDGKLQEVASHPKRLLPAVIARIKVMSTSMKIAEKRLPQDGRIQMRIGDREVDLRVSSVPSNHGESIVMRILNKSAVTLGLDKGGFMSDDLQTVRKLVGLPDGIVLVTGPTGSGKTTTLYSCLNEINKPDRKIITVEDPVEYELQGINQVMVKADIGMTFASALRAMLRQAPNIIMVGEIRDLETASIAINASLTGHLVFSTLHTNDSTSAVARLEDMGVKRFLVASAVRAIIAQRLARRLCDSCKQPVTLNDAQLRALNIDPSRAASTQVFGPVGCQKCNHKGYKGRVGIFEIFQIDDEVRHLINENLSSPKLRKRARELGMRTLREDGVRKVLAGITSAEEIISVTMSDSH